MWHCNDPHILRTVASECKLEFQAYTVARESSGIIAAELAGVSGAAGDAGNAEFRVRASVATREAVAVLSIEDNATLEMAVRLPPSWPLRPAEIECRRKVQALLSS